MPTKTRRRTRHVGRGIPWLRVVRFHREILKRAEDAFFSLPARDEDSPRWSALRDFDPESLAGPWELTRRSVQNELFQPHRQEALYLGGPCYEARRKDWDRWHSYWNPILYREVELRPPDEGGLHLSPAQGKWNLNPLLLQALKSREASLPTDPDKFAARLVESASRRRKQRAMSWGQAVRAALREDCPEFAQIESRGYQSRQPPNWILFAPVNRFSAFVRYLMADYQELEARLTRAPAELGGLAILDDASPATNTAARGPEVRPIVPLNDSQRRAVERALSGHPLTVISGPPGCGKSQVVVSLLLNAWAAGVSVLFASNNNRAVDVVLERLRRFEAEFPVAVRAGNRKQQRIQETLRRAINLRPDQRQDGAGGASSRARTLQTERTKLQEALDSKAPQRADEGAKSMFEAIGRASKIAHAVEQTRRVLGDDLRCAFLKPPPQTSASALWRRRSGWIPWRRSERRRRVTNAPARRNRGSCEDSSEKGTRPSHPPAFAWQCHGLGDGRKSIPEASLWTRGNGRRTIC